jgi:hypothetical protein
MDFESTNPFNITKATDFSDQEIHEYWVDLGAEGHGFLDMVKPSSPMPMLILGGKGSGKTHLMRFFSLPLQKIRHKNEVVAGIQHEKYIGIYFRSQGLNAARFKGKGQTEDVWNGVFSYFMELWFAKLVLYHTEDILRKKVEWKHAEGDICRDVIHLFDRWPFPIPNNVSDLIRSLDEFQKQVSTAVNNCPITQELNIDITASSGRLTFGVPAVLASHLSALAGVRFVYLIDEYENFSESQQKHINSLLREREDPCTFKIGSRLYGIKTTGTMSADEENKEGAEFETLFLDSNFRKEKGKYSDFAKRLCLQRLSKAGYAIENIEERFENFPESGFAQEKIQLAMNSPKGAERAYFRLLRRKLIEGLKAGIAYGVESQEYIQSICTNLSVPQYPLIEKTNIFLFYTDWYYKRDLIKASRAIAKEAPEYVKTLSQKTRHHRKLSKYKSDLIAQLFRESDNKQLYLGFQTFVKMSNGLPRNLLVILKNIYKWALFNEEEPFRTNRPISKDSQRRAVIESSEWFFFHEARMPGPDGVSVRAAIDRLATLFREIRFSDKPSECSLLAFSANYSELPARTREMIDLAVRWSLLIKIGGGQRERNSKRIDEKYQINNMLAPHWDLPTSRRGALSLSTQEVVAIFTPNETREFEEVKASRVKRMNAPFFGREKETSLEPKRHRLLPGFGDD